jgi:hypothetical protein
MINLIQKLWQLIRVPKRIYKYGTYGLKYFDDRSRKEKWCDLVDKWLEQWSDTLKRKKARKSQIWHSYRDIATGRIISSMADLKAIEKETGLVCTTFSEVRQEAKIQAKNQKIAQKRMIKKGMSNIMHNVVQGRSYVKELNDKIRQGKYEIGQKPTMN